MASEVSICNLALNHIGAYPIANLSDASKEATTCNAIYPFARDSVLRDHKWAFATKRLILALLTDTYSGWDYAYQYPTDCLVAHEIYSEYGDYSGLVYDSETDSYVSSGKIEFEICAASSLTSKVILTNKEDAELIYTAKVTDCNMFDGQFIDALAYRLATELAVPIKGNGQMSQAMHQLYQYRLNQAKAISANECYKKPDQTNTFVSARG